MTKALSFSVSFENLLVQILCSHWIINFSELRQKLWKTRAYLTSFKCAPQSVSRVQLSIEIPASQHLPLLKTEQFFKSAN
jgi:hypothetical protein